MKSLFEECSECMGQGWVLVEVTRLSPRNGARFAEPDYVDEQQICEKCDGNGIIEDEQ